jgi:hypothetical protein
MVNYWMMALKEFNKNKSGMWCLPKKGTADYNEVRRIQKKMEKNTNFKKELEKVNKRIAVKRKAPMKKSEGGDKKKAKK